MSANCLQNRFSIRAIVTDGNFILLICLLLFENLKQAAFSGILSGYFFLKKLKRMIWTFLPYKRAVRFYDKNGFSRCECPSAVCGYTEEEKEKFIWYETINAVLQSCSSDPADDIQALLMSLCCLCYTGRWASEKGSVSDSDIYQFISGEVCSDSVCVLRQITNSSPKKDEKASIPD